MGTADIVIVVALTVDTSTPVPDNSTDLSIDLAFDAGITDSTWDNSYDNHSCSTTQESIAVALNFTLTSKQIVTITDVPVIAVKAAAAYVTVTPTGKNITDATFYLREWGASKTFSLVTIQYKTTGDWQDTDVGFSSSSKKAVSAMSLESTTLNGNTVYKVSVSDLPDGVTAIRLVINGTGKSNMQVGVAKIDLTVK